MSDRLGGGALLVVRPDKESLSDRDERRICGLVSDLPSPEQSGVSQGRLVSTYAGVSASPRWPFAEETDHNVGLAVATLVSRVEAIRGGYRSLI